MNKRTVMQQVAGLLGWLALSFVVAAVGAVALVGFLARGCDRRAVSAVVAGVSSA